MTKILNFKEALLVGNLLSPIREGDLQTILLNSLETIPSEKLNLLLSLVGIPTEMSAISIYERLFETLGSNELGEFLSIVFPKFSGSK